MSNQTRVHFFKTISGKFYAPGTWNSEEYPENQVTEFLITSVGIQFLLDFLSFWKFKWTFTWF